MPSPVLEPWVASLCWFALQAHCHGLPLTKGDFPKVWQTLAGLTWAGTHRVVDLLGCSVLDEKELRSSPLEALDEVGG